MPGHVERGFSQRKEEDDASFNVLEALAEHAADIFRDELLLEHLDPTTGSLLYNTSKKLRDALRATKLFSSHPCFRPNCDCRVWKLDLSEKYPCECPGTTCSFKHFVNPELFKTVELAKWAKENGAIFDENFALQAVKSGNIDVLKWVISENCEMDSLCTTIAIRFNHKDQFIILREAGCPIDDDEVCPHAAYPNPEERHGNFELLKWLHEEGYELDRIDPSRLRDTRILDYYYECHDEWHDPNGGLRSADDDDAIYHITQNALERGNLVFAKWFIEKKLSEGITFTGWTGLMIAYMLWKDNPHRNESYDVGIADWARQQGCPEPDEADWHMLRAQMQSASEPDDSDAESESSWETDHDDDA